MLSVLDLQSPSDRQQLLKDFDPAQHTWLVSDLKTKAHLQNEILKLHSVIPEDCILRASELWRKLFRQSRPDYQIVTEDFAVLLIGEWLKDRESWAQTPGAARLAYAHLSYLMPIFGHGGGIEAMKSWFSSNSSAFERWGHWFIECYYLWNQFEKYKIAAPGWLSAHLMNLDFSEQWTRPLWVDLGLRMLTVETEIIANLSKNLPITLIRPSPPWQEKYKSSMGAYDFLSVLGFSKSSQLAPVALAKSVVSVRKFSSPLGEVKDAVAKIRKWALEGIPLAQMACVAPDIKEYETALRLALDSEELPIAGGERASLSSFPEVHAWLCELQVSLGQFESGHLEVANFSGRRGVLPYEEFARIYKIIYDADDLKRAKKLYDEYSNKSQIRKAPMGRREFAAWALTRWKSPHSDRVIRILEKFLSDGPYEIQLDSFSWFQHLSSICTRSDETADASDGGIVLADLHSAENLQADHIVLLGLTGESLRRPRRLGILPKDLWSIQSEIGFNLPLIEDVNAEFDAQWLMESRGKNFSATCAVSDWQGKPVAPSLLWFQLAQGELGDHSLTVPGDLLWDFEKSEEVLSACERDSLGEAQFKGRRPERLSISSIEDYLGCPFVFAAKKLLRCDDSEFVDIELGPQSGGRLRHRIFERILGRDLNWTQTELEALVDEIAEELGITKGAEQIWNFQRRRLVGLAMRFQAFEREWRTQFPETSTIGRELSFEVYFDPVTMNLSTEPLGVLIRGSIDRVDEDKQGRVVILDYKSSLASLSNWQSWVEKKNLQLGFYADVVASGLTSLGQREVVGAFYMSFKDFARDRGFASNDVEETLFSIGRKKFGLNTTEKEELFKSIRKMTAQTVSEMEAGRFNPEPADQNDCADCRWNTLCRARHLT